MQEPFPSDWIYRKDLRRKWAEHAFFVCESPNGPPPSD
jgi:hypothetical protein